MPSDAYKKAALWLFVLALAFRVYHLDLPFLEPYNSLTRQAVGGMVARNFYHHGFNFFYPELDDNGKGPYLFNAEVPICTYLVALAYACVGGVREWAARAVSVAFSMGTLLFFFALMRRVAGSRAAFFALLCAAVSPLNIALSRALQPDAAMLCASAGAVYGFYRYQETGKNRFFALSAAMIALAVAVKAYALYLFLPIAFLALDSKGLGVFREPKNYLYAAAGLLPLGWYAAMWHLGQTQHLAYSTLSYAHERGQGYHSFFQIFSVSYLSATFKIFILHVLTPVGAVFFCAGLIRAFREKGHGLFLVWFGSVVFFMLLFWRTTIEHAYYQLPFILPCAYFAGVGVDKALSSGSRKWLVNPLFLFFITIATAAVPAYYLRGLYFIPEQIRKVEDAGKAIDKIAPRGSLVVASYGGSPAQLYYCDRKGWTFDLRTGDDQKMIERIEYLRSQGAAFFVTAAMDQFHAARGFEDFLRAHYRATEEKPGYVVFGLASKET